MPVRLTLDTNLLQEYWKDQDKKEVVVRLFQLADEGKVELVVTNRIRDDIPNEPLSDRLRELPDLRVGEIGSVFRLDSSALDGPDMLGSDEFIGLQDEVEAELCRRGRTKLPDRNDWDHLHGHMLKTRDVFLTWDKRLLEVAEIIGGRMPVTVMTPEDFLASHGW